MSATLSALQQRKERLDEELKQTEKQVYDLETHYLNESSQHGNVFKGFSMSSTTSPVVEEIAAEQAQEKTVTTQSGRKAGGGGGYR
jgi:chromatin modification-related protein EAF6